MARPDETVGIGGIGIYVPEQTISSQEIAERAGIGADVLRDKIGMRQKPVASPLEQPSTMALAAARAALERASVAAEQVDLLVFGGSAPQDYLLWSASGKLQSGLGAHKALAFEITNGCNGINLGMQVAKDMLLGNPDFRNALVVSADKYSSFIDYERTDDLSLFHVADAAGAALLRKNEPTNRILAYAQITDGAYADYVKIKRGGTVHPYSRPGIQERQTFSVENAKEFNELLSRIYSKNYIAVIRTALEQCGHTADDVDFLFTNQVKASTITTIFESLQIPLSKTYRSIDRFGHMGTVDTLFALSRCLEDRRVAPGDLVVLASSAIGFSWAAMVIQF